MTSKLLIARGVRMALVGVLCLLAFSLTWVRGGVVPLAHAHDANLARWDVSASGRTVSIALRISGSGLHAELRRADPEVDWDGMSLEDYRGRAEAFLKRSIRFEEHGRRLPVTVEALTLGHETTATIRIRRRRSTPLSAFTLDLRQTSARKNQHHLVFVRHDDTQERFMLHRSNPGGVVLHWSPSTPD